MLWDLYKWLFVFLWTTLICGTILLFLSVAFFVTLAWSIKIIARCAVSIRKHIGIIRRGDEFSFCGEDDGDRKL